MKRKRLPPNRASGPNKLTAAQKINQANAHSNSVYNAHELDPIGILQSERTMNINLFKRAHDAGLHVAKDAEQKYNPQQPRRLRHILEYPVYDNRSFHVIEVSQYYVDWKGIQTPFCRILVQNQNHKGTPTLQPFKLNAFGLEKYEKVYLRKDPITKKNFFSPPPFPENCCLDLEICKSAEEARELGDILCRILNRFQAQLPIAT